jgi:predicted component of type VI protein secretion system
MKLKLVVLSEGKALGQTIPVTLSQYIIGRDPQCQLRPASPLISKRHCAVIVRGGKIFVRDFDSTNGTFVNEKQIKGECEIKHEDTLKVGPLAFRVVVEGAPVPVNKPTPLPKALAGAQSSDDDSVAAMLLDLADEGKPEAKSSDSSVPDGSTIMEMAPVVNPQTGELQAPTATDAKPGEAKAAEAAKPADKKKMDGNTSQAAEAILLKYMRRQR